jgi:hypothetical protein
MADTTTPTVGMLGGHVVDESFPGVIRKCAQQTFAHGLGGMSDRTSSTNRSRTIKHLSGGIDIEPCDQCGEITVGEPVHRTGRRVQLHQMTAIGCQMQIRPGDGLIRRTICEPTKSEPFQYSMESHLHGEDLEATIGAAGERHIGDPSKAMSDHIDDLGVEHITAQQQFVRGQVLAHRIDRELR